MTMPGGKRQSFILYCDSERLIDRLSDEEAGRLIKAVFSYANTGVLPDNLSEKADMVFMTVQNYLDRDAEKWDSIRRERSEAGRKGGIESGKTRLKQSQANEASASTSKQNEANEAVSVSVSVSASDSVPVNVPDTVPVIFGDKYVSDGGAGGKLLSYAQFEPVNTTTSSEEPGGIDEQVRAAINASGPYRPLPYADFERQRSEQIAKLKDLPSR